jgi:hypothetical protein
MPGYNLAAQHNCFAGILHAMRQSSQYLSIAIAGVMFSAVAATLGCGTTRSSDTARTATEQLLISDAIDRAVQTINVQSLAGQSVYLDDSRLGDVIDRNYLVSTLRQHLLASGCALRTERDQADFIVEARAGAIGTDRNDLLFGIPSMNVPQILPMQPMPAAIPEVPFAKRRDQRGIAKIAVFAYHRETGMPVWQSGIAHQESSANDVWILGAGPFQRGTIYEGMEFAGKSLNPDEDNKLTNSPAHSPAVELERETTFADPGQFAKNMAAATEPSVAVAAHEEEAAASNATEPAPLASENAQPISLPSPTASALQATDHSAPATTPSESAELRQLMSAPRPNGDLSGLTARFYELPPARQTGMLNVKPLIPKPVDPIPLPQPRFDSP